MKPMIGMWREDSAEHRSNWSVARRIDLEVPSTAEVVIEFEVDLKITFLKVRCEYTGYYTPATLKPVARITAITHRRKPYFQGLLTGKPVTENHILKAIPFEASVYRMLQAQFPTIERGHSCFGRRFLLCGNRDASAVRG